MRGAEMNLKNFSMLFSIVVLCAFWSVQSTHAMFELEEDDTFPHELYRAIQRKDCAGVANESRKLDRQAINVTDRSGKTVLAYAIEVGAPEIVRTLVEMGARVNQKIVDKTPLMLAVECGKLQLVQMLVEFGALCDDYGSILSCAVKSRDFEMVNICLQLPADKASEVRKKVIAGLESQINPYRNWQSRQKRASTGLMHDVIEDYERIKDLICRVEERAAPKKLIARSENRVMPMKENHASAPRPLDLNVSEDPEEDDSSTACTIQ
jgi:hypothetical protein